MTLDEMEKLACEHVVTVDSFREDSMLRKRLESCLDTKFARAFLLVMPVVRAAMQRRDDEERHTGDSNCSAGDHDDCPSRISEPALFEAIDAMRAAMTEGNR